MIFCPAVHEMSTRTPFLLKRRQVITDFYDMVFVSEKLYGYDGGERTDVEYQVLYTGIYDDIGDSVNITTNELGLSAGEIYTVVRNNLNLNRAFAPKGVGHNGVRQQNIYRMA